MAAELLVSVLHHPRGLAAPADVNQTLGQASTPLGIVPHQIRGFLGQFATIAMHGTHYQKCVACSRPVIDSLASPDFALDVVLDSSLLTRVTGLDKVEEEASWEAAEGDDF